MISIILAVISFTGLLQEPGGEWFPQLSAHGLGVGHRFGEDVNTMSDINGDSIAEIVVGAIRAEVAGVPTGKAYVLSGSDGAVIYEFSGQPYLVQGAANDFGKTVNSADVNGDGYDDILVGAVGEDPFGSSEGSAYVFSGFDGSLMIRLDGTEPGEGFGFRVGGLGDLNLDGCEEFFVRSISRDTFGLNLGSAVVYSGKTLNILYEVGGLWTAAGKDGDGLGSDINHDGYPDFILSDNNQYGSVAAYSGIDGTEIYRIFELEPRQSFGLSVATVGDVDLDGIHDFIVGAPEQFFSTEGHAYVFSGADGTLLFEFLGEHDDDQFGDDVAGPGDVDGDGYPDFLVGAFLFGPITGIGAAYLISGFDGRLLGKFPGNTQDLSFFGFAVSAAGDLNQDGLADFLVSTPIGSANGPGSGTVMAFSLDSYLKSDLSDISAAAGGTVNFSLDFPDQEGGKDYQLLVSTDRPGRSGPNYRVPLSASPVLEKTFQQSLPIFSAPSGTLDANGDAVITMTLNPNEAAAAIGHTFRFAAITYQTPTMLSTSSATVSVKILP